MSLDWRDLAVITTIVLVGSTVLAPKEKGPGPTRYSVEASTGLCFASDGVSMTCVPCEAVEDAIAERRMWEGHAKGRFEYMAVMDSLDRAGYWNRRFDRSFERTFGRKPLPHKPSL